MEKKKEKEKFIFKNEEKEEGIGEKQEGKERKW